MHPMSVDMNILPPTQADTFYLLISRYGLIQGTSGQGGWGHGSRGRREGYNNSRLKF